MLADAAVPVPPSVDVGAPVVFSCTPGETPVTLSPMVHVLPVSNTVPPVSEIDVLPAVAVAVPPQVFVNALGVATTRTAGSVSVKPTP